MSGAEPGAAASTSGASEGGAACLRAGRTTGAGRRCCALLLAAGTALLAAAPLRAHEGGEPAHSAELDAMIIRAAKRHGVPERLLRRIVMRESKYNPRARNHRYWGLMQISYPTARSMGFKGSPEELLNPLTNLTYAVPYLANAFIAAGKDEGTAVRLYASGYYDTARRRGILGLLRTAESSPMANVPEPAEAGEGARSPAGSGVFGSLFGSSEPVAAEPRIAAATQAGLVQPVTDTDVARPATPAEAAPRGGALPEGKPIRGGGTLALDKTGRARPPAKWMHDGGLTLLAKGEQSERAFAATRVASGEAAPASRSRKNATFASLDAPGTRPASAQAYAASLDDGSAPPQAAITQALASPADVAAGNADRAAPPPPVETDEGAAHRKHRHHHAHHRAKASRGGEADTSAPKS